MINTKKQNKLAVFLLGPPGAGKGTQAKLLAKKLKATHIGSGDIVRKKIQESCMEKFKKIYDSGKLLPPSVIISWAKDKIEKDKNKNIVLEGFSRTITEAKTVSVLLKNMGFEIKIFNISISPKETIKRNLLRKRDIADTKKKLKNGCAFIISKQNLF